jgi:dinuclear metal center YbgI/SA1388 family protein
MKTIGDVVRHFERFVPRQSQESYDNSGLLVGDPNQHVSGVLIALDCVESIIDEAKDKNCNLVITHHPIIFKGLKSVTGKSYVERTVINAIKNDIAIYAIHTNLDNYRFGVNFKIGQLLGLNNLRILAPREENLIKIVVFVPKEHLDVVFDAMTEAGAGAIGNYEACSYRTEGEGTFRATEGANPFVGEIGELHKEPETRLELLCRKELVKDVVEAMKNAHPYEEVAFDLIPLTNSDTYQGSGMIGELEHPMQTGLFLKLVKEKFNCGVIRHTKFLTNEVRRIAFCGGAGSFLLPFAKANRADVFITSDFKYHEFFDAENKIVIADIGHYESEQFTMNLIGELLNEKNVTFAVRFAETNTNPVKYL